jgi:hypothetical protein
MDSAKYKTKLCRHYERGFCKFGINCHFAHGIEDLKPGKAFYVKQNFEDLILQFESMKFSDSDYSSEETDSVKKEKSGKKTKQQKKHPLYDLLPFSYHRSIMRDIGLSKEDLALQMACWSDKDSDDYAFMDYAMRDSDSSDFSDDDFYY